MVPELLTSPLPIAWALPDTEAEEVAPFGMVENAPLPVAAVVSVVVADREATLVLAALNPADTPAPRVEEPHIAPRIDCELPVTCCPVVTSGGGVVV